MDLTCGRAIGGGVRFVPKSPHNPLSHPWGRRVINLDLNRRIELPLDLSGPARINGD